jgi:hypothetical protein
MASDADNRQSLPSEFWPPMAVISGSHPIRSVTFTNRTFAGNAIALAPNLHRDCGRERDN